MAYEGTSHSYSLITVSGRGSTCDLKIPDSDVVVPLCIAVTKYLTKVVCLFDQQVRA